MENQIQILDGSKEPKIRILAFKRNDAAIQSLALYKDDVPLVETKFLKKYENRWDVISKAYNIFYKEIVDKNLMIHELYITTTENGS